MALGLELPEDALVKIHTWDATSELSSKFLKSTIKTHSDFAFQSVS